MLSMHEMSKLYSFQESMFESDEKELLNKLLFEYAQYTKCGTVEECQNRKEWMSMSIDDIRKNFNSLVTGLRDEVENIRNEQQVSKKSKYVRKNKGEY